MKVAFISLNPMVTCQKRNDRSLCLTVSVDLVRKEHLSPVELISELVHSVAHRARQCAQSTMSISQVTSDYQPDPIRYSLNNNEIYNCNFSFIFFVDVFPLHFPCVFLSHDHSFSGNPAISVMRSMQLCAFLCFHWALCCRYLSSQSTPSRNAPCERSLSLFL